MFVSWLLFAQRHVVHISIKKSFAMLGYGDGISSNAALYSVFILIHSPVTWSVLFWWTGEIWEVQVGSSSGRSRERSWERKVETTVSKSRKNRHSKRRAERSKHSEGTSEEKGRDRESEEWKSRQKRPVVRPAGNEVNSLREMRMGKAAVGPQSSAPPVCKASEGQLD